MAHKMHMVEDLSWAYYPLSWFFYVVCSFVDHIIFFAFGAIVLLIISRVFRKKAPSYMTSWFIFNVALFLAGALVSGFWDILIYGHLYLTADYVSDFSPFVPVTQSTISAHFDGYGGELLHTTLAHLQFVWFLFAGVTWLLAAAIYVIVHRCRHGFRAASTA